MKGKHFLINMGKDILACFSCFPSQAEGLECCPLTCHSKCVLRSGVRMLAYRSERDWPLLKCTLSTYSRTFLFSIPVASCQNAISEILEEWKVFNLGTENTRKGEEGMSSLFSYWKGCYGE